MPFDNQKQTYSPPKEHGRKCASMKRELKTTEKGKNYSLTLVVKSIKSIFKSINNKKIEIIELERKVNEPGFASVISAALSDLTSFKNDLQEQVDKLPDLLSPDAPYLNKTLTELKVLQEFIDSKGEVLNELQTQGTTSCQRASVAFSIQSGITSTSKRSEASIRLQAKLALALQQDKIKCKENKLDSRLAELEKEFEMLKLRKRIVREESIQHLVLSQSLKDAEGAEDVEAVLEAVVPNASSSGPYKSSGVPANCSQPEEEDRFPKKIVKEPVELSYRDPVLLMTKVQVLNSLVPIKYAGDSLNFPFFREQVRTHLEDGILPDSDKKVFLTRFLCGEALKLVQDNFGLSYSDSIDLLERRFGNPVQITEAWVKRLIEGPNLKVSDPKSIQKFSESLSTACRVLPESAQREVNSKICLKKVVSRLPEKYITKWVTAIECLEGKETLQTLATFQLCII